jgi:hypothetical protein
MMNSIRRFFQKPQKTDGGSVVHRYKPTEYVPQLGFSNAPVEWQEFRESQYRKSFGNSENVFVWHEVVPTIPHIDIHVFPPSKELGRNYFTLITSGMSDEKMTLPKSAGMQYSRAEIIFYVASDETKTHQTEKPWYVQAMFYFAHFPFNYKTWLAFSHTLPNGNPPAPIVDGSLLTTALFLPAIFEAKELTRDFMLGNEKVNLLWLTYLNDKETEFKLKHGYDKLIEKFNGNNFPQVFNPFRSSII